MGKSQAEEAKAVECGYWHLWRFDPRLAEEGKNPFQLDSKAPNWDNFQAFLDGEVRYLSLKKVCPNEAQELFDAAKKAAQHRYATFHSSCHHSSPFSHQFLPHKRLCVAVLQCCSSKMIQGSQR